MSLGFPSGPTSTFGGTWKSVKRKMWGGMWRFMMSGRDEGCCGLGEINLTAGLGGSHLQFSRTNVFLSVVRNQVEFGPFDGDGDGLKMCMVVKMDVRIPTLVEKKASPFLSALPL
jgi:hypothetical protein